MFDGTLQVSATSRQRGRHTAIDLFFRTLAKTKTSRAVCIVLSGTGSDGTVGMKSIKEEGGIAIAQQPDEAEYDEMPRNAILTATPDFVLPVGEMPQKLISLLENARRIELPQCGRAADRARYDPPRRSGAARGARDAALADRSRLRAIQARDGVAPHRAPDAGQPGARPARVSRPASRQRRGNAAAAQGHADQRHEFFPRPRSVRGARAHRDPRDFRGQIHRRPGSRLGAGLRYRRGGVLDRDAARRACARARSAARSPDLRDRHRRGRARGRPRRDLSRGDRHRRAAGAASPLLRRRKPAAIACRSSFATG